MNHIATRARDAIAKADEARKSHKLSRHKARKAQRLTALCLLRENQSRGCHYKRSTINCLRGA